MKKDKLIIFGNPTRIDRLTYYKTMKQLMENHLVSRPIWLGFDPSSGHGMVRGEVIERHQNVVHVRFKTVQ